MRTQDSKGKANEKEAGRKTGVPISGRNWKKTFKRRVVN